MPLNEACRQRNIHNHRTRPPRPGLAAGGGQSGGIRSTVSHGRPQLSFRKCLAFDRRRQCPASGAVGAAVVVWISGTAGPSCGFCGARCTESCPALTAGLCGCSSGLTASSNMIGLPSPSQTAWSLEFSPPLARPIHREGAPAFLTNVCKRGGLNWSSQHHKN